MTTLLSVNNITKRRGVDLFAPVSFDLALGEGLGILGFNGCGKTTLLDIIAGLEKPNTGSIAKNNNSLGYVMQHSGFQEALSFKDNLFTEAYLCGLKGHEAKAAVQRAAARLEILPFWNKRYSKGSSGMKSRLTIASAIVGSPELLLLDEAFNFLDHASIEQTRHVLYAEKERGCAIVMVSHNPSDFAGICERVLYLPSAKIKPL